MPLKILMVCLGNICRSPLAEGIMRSKLTADYYIDSAGTGGWHAGEAPDKRSIQTALNYDTFFKEIGVKFRTEQPNTKANYWLMCLELENKKDRDLFLSVTNENRIMTRPIWQLMYKFGGRFASYRPIK